MEFDRIHRNEAAFKWPDLYSFWRFDTFEPKVSFWFSLQKANRVLRFDKFEPKSVRENQKETFDSKVSKFQNEYKSGHVEVASFLCILSNFIIHPLFWFNNYVDNSQIWVTFHTVGRIGVLEQQSFSFLCFLLNFIVNLLCVHQHNRGQYYIKRLMFNSSLKTATFELLRHPLIQFVQLCL